MATAATNKRLAAEIDSLRGKVAEHEGTISTLSGYLEARNLALQEATDKAAEPGSPCWRCT
jgi:hypothetical protein